MLFVCDGLVFGSLFVPVGLSWQDKTGKTRDRGGFLDFCGQENFVVYTPRRTAPHPYRYDASLSIRVYTSFQLEDTMIVMVCRG